MNNKDLAIDSYDKSVYPPKLVTSPAIGEAITWAMDRMDWFNMSKADMAHMVIKRLGFHND